MRKTAVMLSLVLLVALPLVCHAEAAQTWWRDETAGINANRVNTTGSLNTISSTVQRQSTGWGGEWFGIEGLALQFVYTGGQVTSINWALVSSYNGLEPGQSYTDTRNLGARQNDPNTTINESLPEYRLEDGWRPDPVIRLSFDGNTSQFEYALAVTGPTNQSGDDADRAYRAGEWYSGSSFYRVPDTAWVEGYDSSPPSPMIDDLDFGDRDVDFYTSQAELLVANAGTVHHNYAYENVDLPGDYWGETWMPNPNRNYYWEGSIDVTGLRLDIGSSVTASYGMWCGNNMIYATGPSGSSPGVPEPSSLALLPMALTGLMFWRRRRSA